MSAVNGFTLYATAIGRFKSIVSKAIVPEVSSTASAAPITACVQPM